MLILLLKTSEQATVPFFTSRANQRQCRLSLRIDPGIKEGLRIMAEQEHRSLANMVEVMIRDYCKQHNVAIPEQLSLLVDSNRQDNRN